MWHVLLFFAILVQAIDSTNQKRNFTIDYKRNTFLKDGQPFRYVSGSIHYFRVPSELWKDRLQRLRAMGANVLQTYVEWNSHEPQQGQYRFLGQNNVTQFVIEAQKQGLLVILRPGPYIEAERDFGGLPYWLLREDPKMKLRTSSPQYLRHVDNWFGKLLPKLQPLLYQNGGPIIMVQVENEYGSYYACDHNYTQHLTNTIRHHLGPEILLFTTDGYSLPRLRCGKIPNVYATVDFGSNVAADAAFAIQKKIEPHGPSVNSEFYPGWLDHWGYPHQRRSSNAIIDSLKQQLQLGANVNIYVAHGGTSFGFRAGADLSPQSVYQPCPTSYDYDSPISENGILRPKYFNIRKLIQNYTGKAPDPPAQPVVVAYGKVNLTESVQLLEAIQFSKVIISKQPLTFEQMGQDYGFLLYEHQVTFITPDPVLLRAYGVRDRAYVMVNGQTQGILSRGERIYRIPLQINKGDRLQILVENQGRVCFGNFLNDIKGIISPVFLNNRQLLNWNQTSILLNSSQLDYFMTKLKPVTKESISAPRFFRGTFQAQTKSDTFLRLDGWSRGVAFLNGFNLGRYWPRHGPQMTLYVPGVLMQATNRLILMELEQAGCDRSDTLCQVTLTDSPILDGPTPYS